MKRTSAMQAQATSQAGEQGQRKPRPENNVHQAERVASAILGGALVTFGLRRRSLPGAAMALLGGNLLYRGIKGHCRLYQALGLNTARSRLGAEEPEVKRSLTIGKSPQELYDLWRAPDTQARVMAHFAEITAGDGERQHWKVRGPLGRTIAWDSRVVEDRPGELVRWESLEGATLPNEGEMQFRPAPNGLGTEVTLRLRFNPPGGAFGNAAARMLGAFPGMLASKALRRFKSLAETGEIPTLERNPRARAGARAEHA